MACAAATVSLPRQLGPSAPPSLPETAPVPVRSLPLSKGSFTTRGELLHARIPSARSQPTFLMARGNSKTMATQTLGESSCYGIDREAGRAKQGTNIRDPTGSAGSGGR